MTTLPGWHNAIRSMAQGVADALGYTLALDNIPATQGEGVIWLALEILDGPVRSVEAGPTLRRRVSGNFRVSVMAPLNSGTRDALRVADALADETRTASGSGLRYGVPQARTVGRSGQHWLVVIDCPFTADEIA